MQELGNLDILAHAPSCQSVLSRKRVISMNQMLSILNTMCRLQKSAYNPDRDNAGILEVYKAILEIANDKQGYIQKSEGMQSCG